MEEVERLVGSIVVIGGQIEFMLMEYIAYATHPQDEAAREECVRRLFGERGPAIARKSAAALKASDILSDSLRVKLVSICDWYGTTYERRNRAVHDAWVFSLQGEDYQLARVVTRKGATSSDASLGDLDGLRQLAQEMNTVQVATLLGTDRLRQLAAEMS